MDLRLAKAPEREESLKARCPPLDWWEPVGQGASQEDWVEDSLEPAAQKKTEQTLVQGER